MSCNYGFSGRTVTSRCTDVNKWSENTSTCISKIVIIAICKLVIVDGRYCTQYGRQLKN
jgi:hypothetical protein